MFKRIRAALDLGKQTDYVRRYLEHHNMRSAVYMSVIVVALEAWMILSLARMVLESAAAGRPRDLLWVVRHGGWYAILLGLAIAVLIHALRYARGIVRGRRRGQVLLGVFTLACLAFGMRFGYNSYIHGEQVLAFTTMTLFAFGMIIWKPLPALAMSIAAFGGFYLFLDHAIPTNYGTQVNLFTLWISTLVVALSSYNQAIEGARKDESIELANERLRRVATFDELTGIPNMHTFNNAVAVLFEGIEEFDIQYCILYMDIENFKAYNDKNGFAAGDELLREVADGLQRIFATEIVARFSDDHFVALCEAGVAEERARAAHELVLGLRGDVRLRLKTGIYQPVMEEHMNVSQACDRARLACSSIKKHPDLDLCHYDDRLDEIVRRRQYVINNVNRAVDEGWIKVYYQPVVRCADGSGELCGYEALARWDDPEYGFMPPFAFIETLEEFREIDVLDRCIIGQVCHDLRSELDAGESPVPVSLNFSQLDFELYDVPGFMREVSAKHDVPSDLLDVEITESALTEQLGRLQGHMSRLRNEHFSLWLDDFGSGYSSLNVLKDFSFNVLKIDMAFLRGFESNDKARPILQAIVSLAHELGMVTLCEGVETREQFEFLASIGCDRAQGYFFGKPEPTKRPPVTCILAKDV